MREFFNKPEQRLAAGVRQAFVEKHRHGGKNDAAIGVMLGLGDGGIAEPHRTMVLEAFQVRRDPFGQV